MRVRVRAGPRVRATIDPILQAIGRGAMGRRPALFVRPASSSRVARRYSDGDQFFKLRHDRYPARLNSVLVAQCVSERKRGYTLVDEGENYGGGPLLLVSRGTGDLGSEALEDANFANLDFCRSVVGCRSRYGAGA
jgi:hypothetical protein